MDRLATRQREVDGTARQFVLPDEAVHEDGGRGLEERRMQMIAIGGAIGVGPFLGSAKAIQQAGPSVLLSYAVAGVAIYLLMRALAELPLCRPVSGSFATFKQAPAAFAKVSRQKVSAAGMMVSFRANITALTVGGRVRGPDARDGRRMGLASPRRQFGGVAFPGANDVSVERGLTTPDVAEAAVRARVRAARCVVVLADHAKVGNDCFARFGNLSEVNSLVCDDGLGVELAADLHAAQPRVALA